MRPIFTVAFAVLVLAPNLRADEAAEKLVTAGIKAHGGEDNLKKSKAGEYKMKGAMSVLGAELEYTGSVAYQLPGQFKMVIESSLMGNKLSIVQIGDGDKYKTTINGQAQKLDDKTKDEIRQGSATQEIAMLFPLLDKEKYTIKAGKDAKYGDVECATVIVSGKATKTMTLAFDKTTGLLHATKRKALAPGSSEEVDEETLMSDYKEVNGVKIPLKLAVKHDGKAFMSTTFTEAKLSDKLDPKTFDTKE